jgi:hypothetical protein
MLLRLKCHETLLRCKKAYDSVRREVLYNIVIEFGIPMKLVKLIKMCLAEMYSRGKNLSDRFPIRSGLKQRDALSTLFSALFSPLGGFR